jgi:hypothetical protein
MVINLFKYTVSTFITLPYNNHICICTVLVKEMLACGEVLTIYCMLNWEGICFDRHLITVMSAYKVGFAKKNSLYLDC